MKYVVTMICRWPGTGPVLNDMLVRLKEEKMEVHTMTGSAFRVTLEHEAGTALAALIEGVVIMNRHLPRWAPDWPPAEIHVEWVPVTQNRAESS